MPDPVAPADASAAPSSQLPLFDRIGGMKALINAVDVFYNKVLEDPELAPFFEGVEMSRQRTKQVQFLCYAFGGPDQYLGKSIAEAHDRLIRERGVTRHHFRVVARHLREALEQLEVPRDLIDECIANIAPAASVFPEVGEPPVPGPEPVPAEGTPAAYLVRERAIESADAANAADAAAAVEAAAAEVAAVTGGAAAAGSENVKG